MGPRRFFESIPSTQTEALRWAREGAPPGAHVVARFQSAGRGRLSHSWWSPSGGLYLSVVLEEPLGDASLLPLAIGLSLTRLLSREYHVPVRLKWPNDVVVEGPGRRARKVAGVLIDRVVPAGVPALVVAGVGVNVSPPEESFPEGLQEGWAALSEFSPSPVDGAELERRVVGAIEGGAHRLRHPKEPTRVVRECADVLFGTGRRATIDGVAVGVIAGLAENGALLVQNDRGAESILAGSLVVEDP